jgi:hypothetical protein
MPIPSGGSDLADEQAHALDDVVLRYFTAQPTVIRPFGASLLAWAVDGGPPGFNVKLNSGYVPPTGEQIVQPAGTTVYRLYAHFGLATKLLATLQVRVDDTGCEPTPVFNLKHQVAAPVRTGIESHADLYFDGSDGVTVTIAPGRISFHIHVRKRLSDFPDPTVDIDASFGLTVRDGHLESVDEDVKASVSESWYVWLIPLVPFPLALALAMAQGDAEKGGRDAIRGVVQFLSFFALTPPGPHMRLTGVAIEVGDGSGVLQFTWCSDKLLRDFVAISDIRGLE